MAKKSSFNLSQIISSRSEKRTETQIEGQITIQDWMEWKEDIRNRLQETAENFVIIGYRLKQIRDSKMYEKEYSSLSAFALQEYGLSKDVVSRFIKINDRFSVDGNSMELKEEYRGYGYSKLQEMLSLTPEEEEQVSPEMTVKEIRQIKDSRNQEPEEEAEENGKTLSRVGEDKTEEPEETQAAAVIKEKVATSQPDKKESDGDWKEKKPEPKPIELPPKDAVYREKSGKTLLQEITEGSRRYLVIKMRHKYRIGNTIILQEHEKGESTGKVVKIQVAHITDDSGGLIPGYCIIGFLDFEESYEDDYEDKDK